LLIARPSDGEGTAVETSHVVSAAFLHHRSLSALCCLGKRLVDPPLQLDGCNFGNRERNAKRTHPSPYRRDIARVKLSSATAAVEQPSFRLVYWRLPWFRAVVRMLWEPEYSHCRQPNGVSKCALQRLAASLILASW